MQTHKFSQLVKTCQTELLQIANETTEDGWAIYKKQEDVIVYTKRLHKTDSIDCAKAVAILPFPAERITDLLYNHIDRVVDIKIKEKKIVERLSDDACIVYEAYVMPSMIQNRDFLYLYTKGIYENNKIVITSRSIELDDYPPKKEYIRALLIHSGFVIEPIDENNTKLNYILHMDIKGWIPSFLINWNHGQMVERVRKIVAELQKN